jgi:hypothetical protein
MLTRLLPRPADNAYRGHKLALVILGLLLVMKVAISLGSIFNGYEAASSADGIPLDSYTPAGARAVVSLFGLVGLSNLLVYLIGVVVLVRYRSLVPAMFALLIFHDLGKRLILYAMPIARTGMPVGSLINLVLLATMVIGLALSLWQRQRLEPASASGG